MSEIFDVDSFFADSFPTVVSSSVSLDEGDNQQFDSQLLSNYFDTPMVIDEVRVQIVAPYEIAVGNFGGAVRLKLSLGRFALCTDYIPVGCFGGTFDGGTIDNSTMQAFLFASESLGGGFTPYNFVGFFRWKLPRPLVVPVGMPLEAKISRQVDNIAAAIGYPPTSLAVNLAYAGRVSKNKLPSGIIAPIPYVGLFEHQFLTPSVTTSNQLDLYNPFQSTLNVQRFVGRWQNIYLDDSDPLNTWIALDTVDAGSSEFDFPPSQIRTFDGFNITNGFIPGLSIWEANTKATSTNVAFSRDQGVEVMIDATAGLPDTQFSGSAYDGSNTSFVTMIGWRNEEL
jgi:hypothetical protein